jgi:hypothetical protein
MKYGIKIKTPSGDYVWFNWFNEAMGDQSKPYTFDSGSLAEEYAQQHELPNYHVEPIGE